MKPTPRYDFPVAVSLESSEHPAEVAALYEDSFDLELNHIVSVLVIPQLLHDPWPPNATEEPTSPEDACRSLVASARFSVAPSAQNAGSSDTFQGEDGASHTIFYTSPEEHAELTSELARIVELDGRVVIVSQLPPVVQRVILERILPSGMLNAYVLKILGREGKNA